MRYLFFNLYKIFKVHKFLLDFLFADCFIVYTAVSFTLLSVTVHVHVNFMISCHK